MTLLTEACLIAAPMLVATAALDWISETGWSRATRFVLNWLILMSFNFTLAREFGVVLLHL